MAHSVLRFYAPTKSATITYVREVAFVISVRAVCLSLTLSLTLATPYAHAQPILVGCTAGITGQQFNTSRIVTVDQTTGLAQNAKDTHVLDIVGLATQPFSGQLYGLTMFTSTPANALIRIDPSTGIVATIGLTGISDIVEGDLAFHPVSGVLFGVQSGIGPGIQRKVFTIDPITGAATVIGPTGSVGDLSGLAFGPTGALYALDTVGSSNSILRTIDTSTGLITASTTIGVNLGPAAAITFDPATGLAWIADGGGAGATNSLFTYDLVTGTTTLVGPLGVTEGLSGLAFVSVPEPTSMALFLGLGGLIRIWGIFRRVPRLIAKRLQLPE